MYFDKPGQKTSPEGNFLRTDGPLVSSHLQTFAMKLGFALYYEFTKQIVPKGAGVAARWLSNHEWLEGKFPQTIFDLCCRRRRSGKASSRCRISSVISGEAEGNRMGMFFAYFRQAFVIANFVTVEKSLLDVKTRHPVRIIGPLYEP
jgi:hypothetical protein